MTKKVAENLFIQMKNHKFNGWNSFQCQTSMLAAAGSFSALQNDFSMGDFKRWQIHMGDSFGVILEDQTICKGYLDSIPVSYGLGVSNIQFLGRDATAILVDCTYDEEQSEFKNQTRQRIIEKLCTSVNISIKVDPSAQAALQTVLSTYRADPGRYIYDCLLDICYEAGVTMISLGDGKLTLTKATNIKQNHDPISFKHNAVYAELLQDDVDRYSDYRVLGIGIGADNKSIESVTSCHASFSDSVVARYKPLTLLNDIATDNAGCLARARFEARLRAALSRSVVYILPGWMQSDGSIWKINTLAQIDDDIIDIHDTMLIAGVSYHVNTSGQGTLCKIHVVDKDIFSGSASDIRIKTGFDS